MINFADGWSPSDGKYKITKKDLKELVQKLMTIQDDGDDFNEKYSESSYHGGLNPSHVTEIIKYILYTQEYRSVDMRVQVEEDGYHLGILIAKKSDNTEDYM